ncbi:hypothetical protein PM082_002362 [Marasmius tenuissimus]|nr:hypothetical protein PM082_002362 [Marasmius tenuissimus]
MTLAHSEKIVLTTNTTTAQPRRLQRRSIFPKVTIGVAIGPFPSQHHECVLKWIVIAYLVLLPESSVAPSRRYVIQLHLPSYVPPNSTSNHGRA